MLDAVDLSATQAAYETYRRTGEPGELMNTLSLHRFGLEQYGVDEISCIVQGGGSGYQITGRRQSNSELMYFAREDGEDTDEDLGTSYEIQNARHLYNIRFAEMITDAVVYAAEEDEKAKIHISFQETLPGAMKKKMTRVMRHCKSQIQFWRREWSIKTDFR